METVEEEKSYTKWEWFLYIILLPTLFTLILVGIILTFMKVDVISPIIEVGRKIPFVEKILPDSKKVDDDEFVLYENTFNNQTGTNQNEATGQEPNQFEQDLIEKEAQIVELQGDLDSSKGQIEALEMELDQLKQSIIPEVKNEEQRKKIKELAQTYSAMTSSKSAPILSNLKPEEAVQILAEMDSKKKSQILAKMDPQTAADLTMLLKNYDLADGTTDQALAERIKELEAELNKVKTGKVETEEKILEMARSFETMDSTAAAGIIEKMWDGGNKNQALELLNKIRPQSLSNILAKIKPETAAMITVDLTK